MGEKFCQCTGLKICMTHTGHIHPTVLFGLSLWSIVCSLLGTVMILIHIYIHKNLQEPKMYLCANVVFSAPDWDEFMGK